jgi:hypothetical protein
MIHSLLLCRCWLALCCLLVGGCREAAREEEFAVIDLATYRWNNRVVLVFGPSAGDPAVAQQRGWMDAHADASAERDLVVGYIFEDAPGSIGDAAVSAEDARALRERFGVAQGAFRFVLIGKDGGVKRTADAPVPTDELFDQIDAMPMRQREMRNDR